MSVLYIRSMKFGKKLLCKNLNQEVLVFLLEDCLNARKTMKTVKTSW